jgi:hypothetical protein
MPLVLSFFERSCFLQDINRELFSGKISPLAHRRNPELSKLIGKPGATEIANSRPEYFAGFEVEKMAPWTDIPLDIEECGENDVHPEYLTWSVSANGLTSSRQTFETMESYGDTVLKLAATLLAYEWKKNDEWAGEGDIENMKVAFITNFHLFRVGFGLGLNRFMRTLKDPEPKDWIPSMTIKSRAVESLF